MQNNEGQNRVCLYQARQEARRLVMQFLFQCESERVGYFSETALTQFLKIYAQNDFAEEFVFIRALIRYVLENRVVIDRHITGSLQNWNLKRLARTDRCILRMAIAEILLMRTPKKVVINEAVDIAREYGTDQSARFVNGVLDKIVSQMEIYSLKEDSTSTPAPSMWQDRV